MAQSTSRETSGSRVVRAPSRVRRRRPGHNSPAWYCCWAGVTVIRQSSALETEMTATRSDAPASRRSVPARWLPALLLAALAAVAPLAGLAQGNAAAPPGRSQAGAEPVMLNFVNADLEAAVR